MVLGWILIAIIALLVVILVYYFNKFVILSNRIDNSLSQIDVPNLINTVKGFAKHESKIMNSVTEARKALVAGKTLPERMKAGAKLQQALGSIFAIAENYPQLKANENFLQLQQELSAIEDRIAYSRQFYNDSILSYNNSTETFPAIMFARLFGKSKKQFLTIPAEQKAVPKVEF
jgi:LemA protein